MYRKLAKYLIYKYKKKEQGRIRDIRCVPVLHYAIFSGFYKSVTDGPTDQRTDQRTDGRTDGRTDTPSYRDARTHLKKCSSIFVFIEKA